MDTWIELPSEPHQSLNWEQEIKAAEQVAQKKGRLLWKIATGLEAPFYPLDDELRFQAISLALQQFSKDVWPRFQGQTEAVCLYRGTADFLELFSWTERQQQSYNAWLEEEEIQDSPLSRRLFAAEAFAIYFQMLSHRLPDEVRVQLLFDLEAFHAPSEALQMISKERFEHFQIAIRGMHLPLEGLWWEGTEVCQRSIESDVGLVFPASREPSHMQSFDRLLLDTSHQPVKIIFESFLSEDWEGIDRLLAVRGSLSHQGERKLKGFAAAGGEVVYID